MECDRYDCHARDRVRDGHASRVGCGKEPLLYEHPSTLHIGTYVCVAHILAYGMWDPKHTPQRYIAADLTRNETAAVAIKVVVVEMEEGQGESAGTDKPRPVELCGERGALSGSGRRRVHTRRGKQALHN